MTVEDLCNVFSKEVRDAFHNLPQEEIIELLFEGTTIEMTEHEVYAKMILNSMAISADLAVQAVIRGLAESWIISKTALDMAELKPDIRLVRPPHEKQYPEQMDTESVHDEKIRSFERKDRKNL